MDKEQYNIKMDNILSNINPYKVIEDPTVKDKNKIFNLTDKWMKNYYIDTRIERKYILVSETNLPRTYGLPNTYKSMVYNTISST